MVRDGSAASGVLLTAELGDVPVVVAGRMPEVHVLIACASGIARRLAGIPSVQDLTTIIPAAVILPVSAQHTKGDGWGYLLGVRRLGRTADGIVADTTEPCHPSMAGF